MPSHPIAPSSALSPSFVTSRVPVVPASTNSFETCESIQFSGHLTSPAIQPKRPASPSFTLSNLRSASSSPAGGVRHAADLLAPLWPDDCISESHDLHLGPVTDWEWHQISERGKCRQRDGCAEDNKSAHPYKNGVSVRRSIRANRHAMPSEGWMCGPSNPHIRIFQRHTIDAIAVVFLRVLCASPRTLRPS